MRAALLLAISTFSAMPALSGGVAPDWRGTMTQSDSGGAQSYPIHLTRLGDSISVDYPTLKCSGTWKLVAAHGDYKIYEERISRGRLTKGAPQGCIDGIVMFRDGWTEAHLGWFASFEGAPTSAWAIVKPVQK
jgi:hypothetical protein